MMVNILSNIELDLKYEEHDVVIQGEPKSLIKFCIHPDSSEHIWWVWGPESRNEGVKNREDLGVEDIDDFYKCISGNYIQIERDMLWNNNSSLYDIFYDNVIYDVYAVSDDGSDAHDGLADSILSKSREIIATIDTNKSVVISMKIRSRIVFLIEKEDIMRYLETILKNCREGEGEESSSCCSICLEEFTPAAGSKSSSMIAMPCSHLHQFHQDCITQWLRTSYLCPICRSDEMMHRAIVYCEHNMPF
ncbi:E3 ubiquitin-protein ligase [Melia azedarach]|uniref:E3 ubiquitin-protein ligase n=1 Tax=Melia azedarach TaxID=155640 RepID=A0ACC1XF84_MELAZ|nr:E3 ubiquitin-protein ligase [Melia azedarach]